MSNHIVFLMSCRFQLYPLCIASTAQPPNFTDAWLELLDSQKWMERDNQESQLEDALVPLPVSVNVTELSQS